MLTLLIYCFLGGGQMYGIISVFYTVVSIANILNKHIIHHAVFFLNFNKLDYKCYKTVPSRLASEFQTRRIFYGILVESNRTYDHQRKLGQLVFNRTPGKVVVGAI